MKPFSALPPRVLASLLAVVAVVAVAAWLWPAVVLGALAAGVGVTLAGGAWVAWEARGRATSDVRRPTSEVRPTTPLLLFALAAVVLAWLAVPGMYFKDGGELAAAAHGLGVAHPTGFPAFCLLGKGLDLLPAAGAFFRIGLLSVLSAAAAAALAGRPAAALGGGAAAAATAAAVFLGSHAAWLHAASTEVYPLSAAGLAAALAAFAAAVLRRDARALVAGWLLTGLGLGGHVTWPAYAGFAGLLATAALWRPLAGRRAAVLGLSAGAALAGALVVLYLPAAAGRDPIRNWGDPSDAAGLWAHLTGAWIRRSFAGEIGAFRWTAFAAHARAALGTLWDGTGPAWPLALAGLVATASVSRWVAAMLAGVVLGDLLFAAWINPMGIRDLQTGVPATLAVAALAAAGAGALFRVVRRSSGLSGFVFRVGAGAVVAATVGLQWTLAPAERDLSDVHAPREIASAFLDAAPPGASILTSSDDLSAGVAALQAVEDARPDVVALVKQQVADTALVLRELRAHRLGPVDDAIAAEVADRPFERGETPPQALVRAARLLATRGPVHLEPGEGALDRELAPGLVPAFPAFAPAGEGGARLVPAALDALRDARGHLPSSDRWGRDWLGGWVRLLATRVALAGDDPAAILLLREALAIAPDDPKTLNNLAVLLNAAGQGRDALALLARAVELDPLYVRGWRSIVTVARGLGLDAVVERAEARIGELAR